MVGNSGRMGRATKDKRDIYYRKAKQDGYRARSAYKLLQIDEEFNLFANVTNAVDLCAAPGSWSQVLSNRLVEIPNSVIVSVDLQPMDPIPNVIQYIGDITNQQTADAVLSNFAGDTRADIVICDGAPDVTGLFDADVYNQAQLLRSAFMIARWILRVGGTFVAKIFRAKDAEELVCQLRTHFKDVIVAKPRSSRNSSLEAFVVCRGYMSSMDNNDDSTVSSFGIPQFLACGDLRQSFDSDATYSHSCEDNDADADGNNRKSLSSIAPPTEPAYRKAIELRRSKQS